MAQEESKTSQDVKTGLEIEANHPSPQSEPRKKSGNKAKQDADENLPEGHANTSEKDNAKNVDDMMQGKHLEKKYRGGDTTDVDEFKGKPEA